MLLAPLSHRVRVVAAGVSSASIAAYVWSRVGGLPLIGDREAWDGLGLVTKSLEIVALLLVVPARWRFPRVGSHVALAAVVAGVALSAQPVFGLGPGPAVVAATAGSAVAVAVLGGAGLVSVPVAVIDGAVLALALRGGGLAVMVAAGILVGLLRQAIRTTAVPS